MNDKIKTPLFLRGVFVCNIEDIIVLNLRLFLGLLFWQKV